MQGPILETGDTVVDQTDLVSVLTELAFQLLSYSQAFSITLSTQEQHCTPTGEGDDGEWLLANLLIQNTSNSVV